eukprot:CAMPEP_0171477708 /NCGR_PEP_ID=MMETSP0946-20130122/4347_1 /TAXON_ID=109269 /ORGANISM="Vaucheria litorea, Strain CCMP2940" /LENGTH=139 /DNA_ID=CAMNT_0012008213 /DNA_START=134 /DNA_END=553 /DNA_ORIENTATION=-
MTVPTDLSGQNRLSKFLDDCQFLGPVRFVAMNDGAILEAVGNFENLRINETANGKFATVADEGGEFECHLNVDKISGIKMLKKFAKDQSYELYIIRFTDSEEKTVLSAMLHGKEGVYEEGAVDYWKKLKDAFGEDQKII